MLMEENNFGKFQAGTIDAVMREKLESSNVLSDWLHPSQKESRQILEQYEMDLVEPSLKIQGLKNAGINPLTAAAGVAGSGVSHAAPSPASSVNPIGDVAGAVGSVGSAFGAVAEGISVLSKLIPEKENLRARTKESLSKSGLSDAQCAGVLTDNTYKDEDWRTRLNVQRQQFDNMKQELSNMQAIHREIMTHCDEMISQIELNGSAKDYNEALVNKLSEETRWQKELNDWRISHNLHIVDSGIDGYIFDMALRGADISEFNNFIDIYSSYRGSVERSIRDAQNTSDINAAFDKAYNEFLAQNSANSEFAPYFADIEVLKSSLMEAYKELIENPGSPKNFFGKLLNLFYQAAYVAAAPRDVSSGTSKPPTPTPKQR